MTPEKIIEVLKRYEAILIRFGIPKIRMEEKSAYGSLSAKELLAHVHFLCDGVRTGCERMNILRNEFDEALESGDKNRLKEIHDESLQLHGKAGRHLGFIQTCFGFLSIYNLSELMNHNRTP